MLSAPLGWHMLYHAALFETDHNRVPQRIEPAEKAILRRIKALLVTAGDHIEEDVVLDDALYALRALLKLCPVRSSRSLELSISFLAGSGRGARTFEQARERTLLLLLFSQS